MPFGGFGESGTGSYHGKFSFDAFSHPKALLYRKFMLDVQFRYPPFTKFKQALIRPLFQYDYLGGVFAFLGFIWYGYKYILIATSSFAFLILLKASCMSELVVDSLLCCTLILPISSADLCGGCYYMYVVIQYDASKKRNFHLIAFPKHLEKLFSTRQLK